MKHDYDYLILYIVHSTEEYFRIICFPSVLTHWKHIDHFTYWLRCFLLSKSFLPTLMFFVCEQTFRT